MAMNKREFKHSRPQEQVGIVWTYGSLKDCAAMFDEAEELQGLLERLIERVEKGTLNDDDIIVTLKGNGTPMGGTMTVEWPMTEVERLWNWVKK
jgi:hypothetical protein